ncbi:MAG: hypothetical protein PHY23_10655, partial [Oscillospiraceae bacterium]|nr:hypothetical protein [Oscillospiraceae bacterium]
ETSSGFTRSSLVLIAPLSISAECGDNVVISESNKSFTKRSSFPDTSFSPMRRSVRLAFGINMVAASMKKKHKAELAVYLALFYRHNFPTIFLYTPP